MFRYRVKNRHSQARGFGGIFFEPSIHEMMLFIKFGSSTIYGKMCTEEGGSVQPRTPEPLRARLNSNCIEVCQRTRVQAGPIHVGHLADFEKNIANTY